MRPSGRCLLVLALAWALWAAPASAGRMDNLMQGPAPVELVAPADGATLVAGSAATIEWAPLARWRELPKVEEWEAFLSLDGGATYPIRLTPHLDEDIRRFRWQVPPLPTRQASLLLRFGDERIETGVLMPQRFTIVAPASGLVSSWTSLSLFARRAPGAGESARPGEPGVVAWVEGSRRGEGLRQMVAAPPPDSTRARRELPEWRGASAEAAAERLPGERLALVAGKDGAPASPFGRGAALASAGTAPAPPRDLLLQTQRQNE